MPEVNNIQKVKPFVEALQQASNLDENQAKTLIYYCVMTWSEDSKIKIRPIINISGVSGTGKNTIMNQIYSWCFEPKWINARNITATQLRNQIADSITAFIEEADKTRDQKEAENWYQHRYEETGRSVTYGKMILNSRKKQIYREETHNHFGYTVMHTQNPLLTHEMDRRTLRMTLTKDSSRGYRSSQVDASPLVEIAMEVDWNREFEQALSNSAWDVWLPLVRVAGHLGDSDFIEYAEGQIKLKTEEDDSTKVFEPKGIVLAEVAILYEKCLADEKRSIAITDIRETVQSRGYNMIERDIVKHSKDLGFTVVYPKNKAYIKVLGELELEGIFERAGVADHYEEDIESYEDEVELPELTHTPILSKT